MFIDAQKNFPKVTQQPSSEVKQSCFRGHTNNHHALFIFSTLKKNCETSEKKFMIGNKKYMIEKEIIEHIWGENNFKSFHKAFHK